MDELTQMSASKLALLIRTRAVSPVAVVEAHLSRIERLNPRLNAVVTLAADALDSARRAESAIARGEALGRLHGLPVTIKDTIETRGLRTTYGSALYAESVPRADAPAVARLRAAGAIIIGKTNASEFALEYTAENPVFGRTINPHDAARTPGGSSGGCAAAVAACLTPASLGSDLAGSVRIPAHFCGVVSLRPTSARVPVAGHLPPTVGPFSLGASLGPLARRVEDLELLLGVLSEDGADTTRGRMRAESASDATRGAGAMRGTGATGDGEATRIRERVVESLRGMRVAWWADDGVVPVTDETRAALKAATEALGEAGLEVFEGRPPGVERAPRLWSELFSAATRRFLRETYAGREAEGGEVVRAILERSAEGSAEALDSYFGAWMERDALRAALVEWMKETPLIVAPVGAVPAFAHGARRVSVGETELSVFRAFGYAQAFNVFDLPAACVPAGRTREGLPVGVQIVGRPFDEATVLAAARIVEAALGGWQMPM